MKSSSTLPPLQALRVFEAVGRLLSFRRAGEELFISQSAVSHHIRRLEEMLDTRLFTRDARSISLTVAGERYLASVSQAFEVIAAGTHEITGHAGRKRLRISLLPSFAANWLVPRLERFRAAHPDVDLELSPTLSHADLSQGEADVAIRYGAGNWPRVQSELLMLEHLTPVMSPRLFNQEKFSSPAALLNHILITSFKPLDWNIWAEAAGIDIRAARRIELTDYNIVIQAAIDAQGVAMGRMRMLEDRLRTGVLIAPCALVVTSPLVGYWLLQPARRQPSLVAQAFSDWLRSEVSNVETR